ncbi:CoA-binding protein [Endomicrobium proavitum]|uniref:CoA-binding domain protein n=1 Tax=Endomicrobium proavitum TaxID=1408281 RepID=A0A0G3WM17_9BACT|nr:CoA-binding protein [Endomicrobium proavitum]AKL98499.1 CoA-binding domain protein [Endomicrobium proavitum]
MDENKKIAVVGVSENQEKFGYKIFSDLLDAGFNVEPVGVRGGVVREKTIYKTLADLPQKPDIVLTVVPPIGTDKTVDDAVKLGIKEVWMQPGSRSENAVNKARAAGMKVTDHGCFMAAHGVW